jgi:FtsH-binding integral membrane protein
MDYSPTSWSRTTNWISSFVAQVYAWMFFALALTAITAVSIAATPPLVSFFLSNPIIIFGLIIVELAMVAVLAGLVTKISPGIATLVFIGYSILNGITLSMIFLAFTTESIAVTFFVTSGMFGVMSIYGYVTKTDLTKIGNLLFMALIGLIIASIVNIFLVNSVLYWITSFIGVLIFVGLTAYDTQKIKRMSQVVDETTGEARKTAILGALALYLDFINLFLFMLRFAGVQRQ